MNTLSQTLWSLLLVVAAICIVTTQSPAQSGSPYHTSQSVSGTIRIWGDEFMSAVTKNWADGFRKYHPNMRFEIKLMGTATAMPAIYTYQADLALLGRESNT